MSNKHKPYCASYLILEDEGKILLLKRKNTGFKDGKYSLVAGHVDEGENFREAMIREAKEEIGVRIQKKNLETVSVVHRSSKKREYVDIYFRTEEWEGKPENMEPGKCADLSWFARDDLPENVIDYIEEVLTGMKDGMTYREIGWD